MRTRDGGPTHDSGRSGPAPNGQGATVGLVDAVLDWYSTAARDLPWRGPDVSPWSVMVSEFMLQQTPVVRVLPVHGAWLERWPTPAALAADEPGEAVRAWGRLGYPRRALRLHAAAVMITDEHGGDVPSDLDALRALPGVGSYTAAAIASFAFGQRHAVLDTNVRRVLARAFDGTAFPPASTTAAETALAESIAPQDPATAARWAVAVMELGAIVCAARTPACHACPVAQRCAWNVAGRPAHDGPPRRGQTYAGTDRQVRGRLLAVLRDSDGPVTQAALDAVWADSVQRARALDSLVADGLVDPVPNGQFQLPVTRIGSWHHHQT